MVSLGNYLETNVLIYWSVNDGLARMGYLSHVHSSPNNMMALWVRGRIQGGACPLVIIWFTTPSKYSSNHHKPQLT